MATTTTKQIKSYRLLASLSSDACEIEFTYDDGTTHPVNGIPAARFNAIVAVLESTRNVYMSFDDVKKISWVSSSPDLPGD